VALLEVATSINACGEILTQRHRVRRVQIDDYRKSLTLRPRRLCGSIYDYL
jgi:hypothetical protein